MNNLSDFGGGGRGGGGGAPNGSLRPGRQTPSLRPCSTHPYHPSHILSESSYISPLPPPHFYRPIPNHLLPSTCPNHLNLYASPLQPRSEPKRLYEFTLRFLSFSDTLHIHLTIICSVLSRLYRFAFFIVQVSVPYINTFWTKAYKKDINYPLLYCCFGHWCQVPCKNVKFSIIYNRGPQSVARGPHAALDRM